MKKKVYSINGYYIFDASFIKSANEKAIHLYSDGELVCRLVKSGHIGRDSIAIEDNIVKPTLIGNIMEVWDNFHFYFLMLNQ